MADDDDISILLPRFVAEATAAADTLAPQHRLPIAYQHVQDALEQVCDLSRSEYLVYLRLTQDEMLKRLANYPFPRQFPEVLADLHLDHSILPPGATHRLDERTVSVHGELWRVHKNDPDPFPSNPHGHNLETGHKLHLGTGELFRGTRLDGKINRKDLVAIRQQLAGIALPELQA